MAVAALYTLPCNATTVTAEGWKFCKDARDSNCVAQTPGAKVEVFTREGLPAGSRSLAELQPPTGAHDLLPEYSLVKIKDHGCTNREATVRDDSCWVEQHFVNIPMCREASFGSGHGRDPQATAGVMGSGAGCRQ